MSERLTSVSFLGKTAEDVKVYTAVTPINVINQDFFEFCCQYHALNIRCMMAQSELVKVETENVQKLAPDWKTAFSIHSENVESAQAFLNTCQSRFDTFKTSLTPELSEMFDADTFAKVYTYRLMNVTSMNILTKNRKNESKALKVPVEPFNEGSYKNISVKGAFWKLSQAIESLFDSSTPKAVKQETIKPLVAVLNEMFGVNTLNREVYKLPNFDKIATKHWSDFSQTLKTGKNAISSGVGFSLQNMLDLLLSLSTVAMTHLKVVEPEVTSDSKKITEMAAWAKQFTESMKAAKEKVANSKEKATADRKEKTEKTEEKVK